MLERIVKLDSFTCSFTESQHGGSWKGSLGIIQSNPQPKQGYPEQAAQDHVQTGFEYLRRRRLHNPSGQPDPGLCHPQREEVLPSVQDTKPRVSYVL